MPAQLFDPTFLKKLEMLTLAARQLFRGQTQGERRATSHGASVEFADFRPYVQGDDFRRIDWNAFARFETLMLRLFVEEQELSIHILLDCSASMDYPPPPRPGAAALVTAADPTPTSPPGAVAATKVSTNKFDYARRLAAALAYIGLANTDQVSLTPFGGPLTDKELAGGGIGGGLGATIGPRRGKPAIIRLMEALEDLKAGGQAEGDPAAGGGVGTPRRHGGGRRRGGDGLERRAGAVCPAYHTIGAGDRDF